MSTPQPRGTRPVRPGRGRRYERLPGAKLPVGDRRGLPLQSFPHRADPPRWRGTKQSRPHETTMNPPVIRCGSGAKGAVRSATRSPLRWRGRSTTPCRAAPTTRGHSRASAMPSTSLQNLRRPVRWHRPPRPRVPASTASADRRNYPCRSPTHIDVSHVTRPQGTGQLLSWPGNPVAGSPQCQAGRKETPGGDKPYEVYPPPRRRANVESFREARRVAEIPQSIRRHGRSGASSRGYNAPPDAPEPR
jgi:hypothetical protein